MNSRPAVRLPDHEVLPRLGEVVARARSTTAEMLVLIARADAHRLYAAHRYDSMYAYCLGELHMSEDEAYTRIRAARLARRIPALLSALADGRLHLTAVRRLAPYLTRENASELLQAAAHKSKLELEKFLAERFPRPDLPTLVAPIPGPPSAEPARVPSAPPDARAEQSPGEPPVPERATCSLAGTLPVPACAPVPERVAPVQEAPPPRVAPLAPGRYALQCTLDEPTFELLRKAQELLGHTIPSRDPVKVLAHVLADWVRAAERRKFGLTVAPRAARAAGRDPRYIPAAIKRAVIQRDGGQCTFVAADGRRCESRTRLEFDHVTAVARGGQTTIGNLRLRCRTHNQHEAERVFGAGFMAAKRAAAQRRAGNPALVLAKPAHSP
jgi:hypothetical protein